MLRVLHHESIENRALAKKVILTSRLTATRAREWISSLLQSIYKRGSHLLLSKNNSNRSRLMQFLKLPNNLQLFITNLNHQCQFFRRFQAHKIFNSHVNKKQQENIEIIMSNGVKILISMRKKAICQLSTKSHKNSVKCLK